MTDEEKQLVLIDLCARLPYGVKIINTLSGEVLNLRDYLYCLPAALLTNFKPCLRPMSSMTPEEQIEYEKRVKVIQDIDRTLHWCDTPDSIEWLQKNHFDYHHMIEKGLALAALEGMYN